MGFIPALTTISGTISAAPHNNNYSAIRTYVNTYAAFLDQSATISGAWTFSTSPTITNALTVGTGLTVTAGGATITAGGLTVTAGGITATGNSTITGTLGGVTTLTATQFVGGGAGLTGLDAAALTGTLPAISGVNLTNLNATNLASGTVANARLNTALGGRTFSSVQTETFTVGGVATNGTVVLGAASVTPTDVLSVSQYHAETGGSTGDTTSDCPVATQSKTLWLKVTCGSDVGWIPMVCE